MFSQVLGFLPSELRNAEFSIQVLGFLSHLLRNVESSVLMLGFLPSLLRKVESLVQVQCIRIFVVFIEKC